MKFSKKEFYELAISELDHISPKGLTIKLNAYCTYNGYDLKVLNAGSVQHYLIFNKETNIHINDAVQIDNVKNINEEHDI